MTTRKTEATTRILLMRAGTIIIFLGLAAQLANLQFVRGSDYRERATFNRIRVVREEGTRGVIYDQDGRMLARNTAQFSVALIPAKLPDDPDYTISQQKRLALYEELLKVIETAMIEAKEEEARAAIEAANADPVSKRSMNLIVSELEPQEPHILTLEKIDALVAARELGSAYQPVMVAENLPRDVAVRVEEERFRLPGVELHLLPMREYLSGPEVSQVIGYMGPIPAESSDTYLDNGYNSGAWVGWTGLEYTFEDTLRGRNGRRMIEVDVNGRERAVLGEEELPEPGHNLILSLDLELQQAMTEALQAYINPKRSHSAAAVAIDPRNGFVRGLVSLPTYDNNAFADGITEAEYTTIANTPGQPLLNHAIGGIYPPGSTFKLVPAGAGLHEGVIAPDTLLNAPGIIYVPNRNFPDNLALAQPFVCWINKQGGEHGDINIKWAIAESCDIFFYKLGGGWYATEFEGLGAPILGEYAEEFGFGEYSGIDLPGEHPGLIPNSKWKRITKGERWVTGDTYNMSIGQGDVLATPLQVAQMTAVVANDGLLFRPQLVAAITDSDSRLIQRMEPELTREITVDPRWLDIVREGMWMAVNWEFGTAEIAALEDVSVAGKTGTSEFFDPEIPRDRQGNLPTHAWFTAFAPYEDPEIVITVFVFNGGEGSEISAPITRDIMRSYFDIKARDEEAGSRSVLEQLEADAP